MDSDLERAGVDWIRILGDSYNAYAKCPTRPLYFGGGYSGGVGGVFIDGAIIVSERVYSGIAMSFFSAGRRTSACGCAPNALWVDEEADGLTGLKFRGIPIVKLV